MKTAAVAVSFLAFLQAVSVGLSSAECNSCPNNDFMCGNKCVCIPNNWVCDGDEDCEDGSDEECEKCPETDFTCSNGHCIQMKWVCDKDNDCGDLSDELSCPQRNCSNDEFLCNNGNCVPKEWQCDGEDDCEDSSDEHCTHNECTSEEFQCGDGTCISKPWKCDGEPDCANGSDEQECDEKRPKCNKEEFQCKSTFKCIRREFLCDDENDCGDGEDETGCGNCQRGEFNCSSGICINKSWWCDGDFDCDDHSDEANCTLLPCTSEQFRCDSGFCIDKKLRCDGQKDCADHSDEKGCRPKKCRSDQFSCDGGKCLGLHKVCNGRNECQDGSDESSCDHVTSCAVNNGGCSHNCKPTPHGARCWCHPGYKLADNKTICRDIDECSLEGACSQICRNTEGSFQCSCVSGYQLKPDGRGCKALGGEAYLIFANRVDIRRVTPDKTDYTSILQGLQNAIALDFHHQKGLVFWSDVTLDVIKRAHLNGSNVMDIVSDGLENPGGLAIDWIHDKLFWTDAGTSRIEVSNLDGSSRKVILWQNLEKPRAIAAHPRQGQIFWTDWGTTPRIERAGMDGSLRMILANSSLFWPNGLTVDYAAERLYWADAKHHVIECANLDGTQRRTVISEGLPHPFALTIFEDELYWTDWYTKSINKANKFSGSRVETIRSSLFFPMDIHTFHPQRQPPAKNLCGANNGGCSHLCLPNESGFTCSCPTGLVLNKDRKNCAEVMDTFVLFSTQSDIRRISLDVGELMDVVIPLGGVQSAVGVEFDSITDSIYWTDVGADSIGMSSWDGKNEKVIASSSLDSPSGISFDWAAQNLYWTDSGNDRIEVCATQTKLRTVLIWRDLDHPRDIVVHPQRGYMFWTELGESAKIERASMDGTERQVIIGSNTTWPNGLGLDFETDHLYWVDAGTRTLESCTLSGGDRKAIISTGLQHPFGVTVFGQVVYWTDWDTGSIHYADKTTGGTQGVVASGFGQIMDLKVFHRKRSPVVTPCSQGNGGCSHICLLNPRGHTCACPTGIIMSSDGKQCQSEMRNFLIFTRRQEIRKISLEVEYFMDVVIPVGDLKNAIAIDVDVVEGKMYWTDTWLDKISRANLNGSNVEKIIEHGIHTADGLAVDSVGRKLYWTDDGHNRIQVANLDGTMVTVLIYEDLDKPRAIALHYDKGYIFWTDWGSNPRIERADMDGKNRQIIISEGIEWPNGLTIDRPTNRIIWADARKELIECADLSGKNRRKLVTKVSHPYGLTVAGNSIYWTDWRESSIHEANKNLVANVTRIKNNLHGIMDIHAVQFDGIQTHVNRCGKNNGGCSHLCLPNPRGISCLCPTGILMKEDGKTCRDAPTKYLLFAARESIRRISLDTSDYTDVYLSLPDLHNVIALDYDYHDNMVYYTDVYLDVIRRASLNGSQWLENIVLKELATTDGLAVDWIARNLYWTDSGHDVIEVSRLDGSSRKTIIQQGLFEPRAIALFPKKGLMFWTDWGAEPKIERAYLDGSSRKIIIDSQLGYPNALSIDYDTMRLYWVDAKLDKIETSDLAGRHRMTIIQNTPHPFGLTVFQDYIYWTDWQTEKLERANKLDGKNRVTIQSRLEGLMDVHIVAADRQTGINNCSFNNGGCTHLCLARPDGYVCACPNTQDARPCRTIPYHSAQDTPNIINIDINAVHPCSSEDKALGVCDEQSGDSASSTADEDHDTVPYVVVAVTLGVLICLFIVAAFFVWKRQRRRHYNVEEFSALTYSNPTYQKASTETINSENRKTYALFRYHASDEQLTSCLGDTDCGMNHKETVALMHPHTTGLGDAHSALKVGSFKSRQTASDGASSERNSDIGYKSVLST
ncbi:low-density lipoprotein receptor-related protein 4-like isoform X3 [Biomphalaria glabrata]|uniref:Low-density lipoprotein receptor-related protein 4-like isoform X3 n=1 Tax=Biomphalaria glabrata TaxID=6526 RepID=A0A9W3BJH0_BIOGL|nr:low-density lipoprotein receptor-related protein 4-like isoform X3 [Biomphalaria glabrata]